MKFIRIKNILISTLVFLFLVSCSSEASENPLFPVIDDSNALPQPSPRELDQDLMIIWETYSYLAREFVGRNDMDKAKLAEGAVNGMFEALNDRHSGYIPPDRFNIDQTAFQGKFYGIGATVGQTKDGICLLYTSPSPRDRG